MPVTIKLPLSIAMSLIMFSLLGCGEKTVIGTNVSKLESSQNCIDCHEAAVSSVTGKSVTDEWKLSAHNLNNKAGCADCHFESLNNSLWHPDCTKCHGGTPTAGAKGLPPYAIKNPDSYGSCVKCHSSGGGFGMSTYNGITLNTLTNHFSTPTLPAYTSGKYKARYVTKSYEKNCRSCHNPHDTTSQMNILRQWARSGKGDVAAPSWTNYDFGRDPTRSTATPGATPANSFGADCVRCHTATGHINYLTNKGIGPATGASKTGGKEVLACNVCHVDYSYARRQLGAVTAYYNKSTASKMRIRISVTYPNIGESNICLNCHVGRETGKIIKELADPTLTSNKIITPNGVYNFKNASFENSHYLTAGATIFRTSGFEFYSSQYYDNPSFYAHDQIGTSNFNNTGTSGPCITCHMKPGNHTFLPFSKDNSGNITALNSTACNNASCHNNNNGNNNVMSVSDIEHQKVLYNSAMDALKVMLQRKGFYFSNSNPYFFTNTYTVGWKEDGTCAENLATKNWQTGGATVFTRKDTPATATAPASISCTSSASPTQLGTSGTGPNNMGAAFNYNLLYHDFGAFAHNRFYARRLIYDSIDWLYDGAINKDSKTALQWLNGQNILGNTTKYIDDTTYAIALKYLSATSSDSAGSLGIRP